MAADANFSRVDAKFDSRGAKCRRCDVAAGVRLASARKGSDFLHLGVEKKLPALGYVVLLYLLLLPSSFRAFNSLKY